MCLMSNPIGHSRRADLGHLHKVDGQAGSPIGPPRFQVLLLFCSTPAGSPAHAVWFSKAEVSLARTAVLGLTVGALSAVLYIAAQIAANPATLNLLTGAHPPAHTNGG